MILKPFIFLYCIPISVIFFTFVKNLIMWKLTFLLVFISMFGYSQTPITDANFETAINTCLTTNPIDGLCSDSEYGAMPDWDVSSVTDMSNAFSAKSDFNADISSWDVSNVTNMNEMFSEANSFNQNLNNWDTSNVISMVSIFKRANSFNGDISDWDTSSVTNMSGLAIWAQNFNSDISGWDVSNVTSLRNTFLDARAFNQDISSWDVSNVIDMNSTFTGASSFNQDISSWDVSNVIDMSRLFTNASLFNQDIGDWDVSNVTDMWLMFSGASSFNQDISNWNVSNVVVMNGIVGNTSLSTDNYDRLLNSWSEQDLQSNVTFGAQGINYCNGEAARQKLIDDFEWTIEDAGLDCSNILKPTWELLNSASELPKSNFVYLPYSFDKENRIIYLLNVKENWMYSYDIDTNVFTPIQADNYPNFDRSGSFVFNPSKQSLQFWRSGTDKVYEVSTNGGNITQTGNGNYNSQLYGSDAIYNGVSINPALMNGYGYYTQKNAAYELIEGTWEEKRGNMESEPFKRGTIIYPNEDYTKAYIIDGMGNASGNQRESSCSLDGGLPWATDVGKYCWLRDLWEIDLSDWSMRSILPLNSNFTSTGSFGYDYKNKTFYSFGGFTPPSTYGQELQWSNTLRVFNPNSQSGWVDLEQYGDIPPIGKSYVSYFDEELDRFIVCSNQGIWALNLEGESSLSVEKNISNIINIYPNPVDNQLIIDGLPNTVRVSIYNLLGKLVFSKQTSREVNVSQLQRGVYILKLNDGEKEVIKKFIKN